jgi:hypothetical protein
MAPRIGDLAPQKSGKWCRADARKKAHFHSNCFTNYIKMSHLKKQQKKQRIS